MSQHLVIRAGRKRTATLVTDEPVGAEDLSNYRLLVAGFSTSNIVFLNLATGSDANSGATELLAKGTYAGAVAVAAGKKIRVVNNGAIISANITIPTEMKQGVTGSINGSLTAPLNTFTQAATPSFGADTVAGVTWSPELSLLCASGQNGKIATSPDGNVWTQRVSSFIAGDTINVVKWVQKFSLFYAFAYSGTILKMATSPDGITWTQNLSLSDEIKQINISSFVYADSIDTFLITGSNSSIAYSRDGINYFLAVNNFGTSTVNDVAWSPELSLFIAVSDLGQMEESVDGINWTLVPSAIFGASIILGVCWSGSKFCAVGGGGKIAYSSDGQVWFLANTPSFAGDQISKVIFIPELNAFISNGGINKMAQSPDANTWTQVVTPSFGVSGVQRIAWSPELRRAIAVGANKLAFSSAFTITISQSVSGFNVMACLYSGTITLSSCTFAQPSFTNQITVIQSRINYSETMIRANLFTVSKCLVKGNLFTVCTPVALGNVKINSVTSIEGIFILNASSTNFEQLRDNIVEGEMFAKFNILLSSGYYTGIRTNCLFDVNAFFTDPLLVDNIEGKLQYQSQGFMADSPAVSTSVFFVNSLGLPRNIGAWGQFETNIIYVFQRAFNFLLPSKTDSVLQIKHNRTNLHTAEDGTPDVVNNPSGIWEEIVLNCGALPQNAAGLPNHIEFVDYLESLIDMGVEITLDADYAPAASITTTAAAAIDGVYLDIIWAVIRSGDRITIAGVDYSVVYVVGTTRIVLSESLKSVVSNGQVIPVKTPVGYGAYQYAPQQDRKLSRWLYDRTDFLRGLTMRFVRKWV